MLQAVVQRLGETVRQATPPEMAGRIVLPLLSELDKDRRAKAVQFFHTEDAFWLRSVPGKVRWFTRPGLRGGRIRLVRAQFSAGADASTLHRRRNRRAHRLDHRGVPLGQDGPPSASGYAAGFTVLASPPPSPPHCSSLLRKPASPWRRLARFRPCPARTPAFPLTHCVSPRPRAPRTGSCSSSPHVRRAPRSLRRRRHGSGPGSLA